MAVEVASAYITLMPSMKGFQGRLSKEMRGVGDKPAEQEGRRAGGKMGAGMAGAAGGALRKAFTPLAAAAGAAGMTAFFGGAVSAASNREQARGATEAIWGPLEKEMSERARKASQQIGLSETAHREAANLLGTQLINRGFEGDALLEKTDALMLRAADLSAMYGGTTQDAISAINAVMRGEFEQIERYGVSMKMADVSAEMQKRGLNDLEGQARKTAEAQVMLDLMMQQTSVSAGTFARESNTLAGQQQRLGAEFDNFKATLGEAFLPVLTGAFSFVNATAIPALKDFAAAWRDGEGPVGSLKNTLSGAWETVKDGFGYVRDWAVPILSDLVTGFRDGEGAGGLLRDALTFVKDAATDAFGYVRDTAIPALQDFWKWLTDNEVIIWAVGGAVLAYQGYLIALNTWTKAVTIATTIWTGVQKVLNGVLKMNPIGLVIAAIGALVAVVIYAYNENETFRRIVDKAWAKVKESIQKVVTWFRDTAWPAMRNVYDDIKDGIDKVKGAFERAKDGIETAWNKVRQAVAKPIVAVIEFVNSGIIDSINKVFKWATGENALGHIPVPGSLSRAARGFFPSLGNARVGAGPRYALASGGIVPGYSPGKDDHFFLGDKFNLALAGGEAVMRPEWTRAVGPHFVEEMNFAARTGGVEGVRRALTNRSLAYANGGIFTPQGGPQGDSGGIAAGFLNFLKGPASWLRSQFERVAERLTSNPLYKVITGFISKGVKVIKDKVMDAVGFGGDADGPGRAGKGLPWQSLWALVKAAAPEAVLTSAFRPGARTAGYGNLSMHALGRAIDIAPASMATYRKVMNLLPWTEAIFSPAGPLQKRNGRFYTERNPRTIADHWDHIHLAYERGGIVPTLYDEGGWLQPGVSLVANKTNKPEAILTDEQLSRLKGGDTVINVYGVPTDEADRTAEEILYQKRRVSHGKYAFTR